MASRNFHATLILAAALCGRGFAAWETAGGNGGLDYTVNALTVFDGKLYAAGGFLTADKVKSHFIASWDGAKWDSVGDGLGGTWASSLCVFKDELYVGGNLNNNDPDHAAPYLARLSGSHFVNPYQANTLPPVSYVNALCVYKDRLHAAGDGAMAVLTDTGWSKPAALGAVAAMAVYKDELYVGGISTLGGVGGTPVNMLARWNGTSYSDVAGGVFDTMLIGPEVHNLARITSMIEWHGDLYVGGMFKTAGGKPIRNLAKWDGSEWSDVGGGPNLNVFNLSIVDSNLFVVGTSLISDNPEGSAMWNGSAWSNPYPAVGQGSYVAAQFQGGLYVGGNWPVPPKKGLIKWSGSSALRPAGPRTLVRYVTRMSLESPLFRGPDGGWFTAAGRARPAGGNHPLIAIPR